MLSRLLLGALLVALTSTACDSEDEPGSSGELDSGSDAGADDTGIEADAVTDAPDPDCTLKTVVFNLRLVGFDGKDLVDATVTPSVCRANGGTTDATGRIALPMPTSKAAYVEIEHPDVLPTIIGRVPLKSTLAFNMSIPPKSLAGTLGFSESEPMIWPAWFLQPGTKLDRSGFVFDASPGSFEVAYLDAATFTPIAGANATTFDGQAVLTGGAEGDVTLSVTGGKFEALPNMWYGETAPVYIRPGWVTRLPIVPDIYKPTDAPPPPPPPLDSGLPDATGDAEADAQG